MASRHHSLQTGDLEDTTDTVAAFQEHNQVRIELRLSLEGEGKGRSLVVAGLAHDPSKEIGEVPPLASVSVRCSGTNLKTLASVLTHVMYTLDFRLAANEWDAAKINKA